MCLIKCRNDIFFVFWIVNDELLLLIISVVVVQLLEILCRYVSEEYVSETV